jgi:hypothetical protein
MFYRYNKNNSFGQWREDENLAKNVHVEANSEAEANTKAESVGIYFNGCDNGQDCPCCGDRWSEPYGDGTEVPSDYGDPIDLGKRSSTVIHYADGTKLDLRLVGAI